MSWSEYMRQEGWKEYIFEELAEIFIQHNGKESVGGALFTAIEHYVITALEQAREGGTR